MKRWAIILFSTIFILTFSNNIFASGDVNIYSEPEIIYDGRIEINFQQDNGSPVKGIRIELYYYIEDEMHNINDLEIFKKSNHNLVSDENGKVIITNLPYGFYQYKICDVPYGYTYNTEYINVELNLIRSEITDYQYLAQEVISSGGIVNGNQPEEEQKPEPIPEENVQPETSVPENNKQDEEIDVPKTDENKIQQDRTQAKEFIQQVPINDYANDISKAENIPEEESTEQQKVMKQISKTIKEKVELNKREMIQKLRQYKVTDLLKIAVVNNRPVYDIYKVVDNPDKIKSKKNKIKLNYKIVSINKKEKNDQYTKDLIKLPRKNTMLKG